MPIGLMFFACSITFEPVFERVTNLQLYILRGREPFRIIRDSLADKILLSFIERDGPG